MLKLGSGFGSTKHFPDSFEFMKQQTTRNLCNPMKTIAPLCGIEVHSPKHTRYRFWSQHLPIFKSLLHHHIIDQHSNFIRQLRIECKSHISKMKLTHPKAAVTQKGTGNRVVAVVQSKCKIACVYKRFSCHFFPNFMGNHKHSAEHHENRFDCLSMHTTPHELEVGT